MDTRSSDLQKLEHTAIVRRFSATHPLITGALPGLAGTAETQGAAGGSWCQHSSASGKNLPAFHQLWIRLCLIGTTERGLSDFYFCVTLAGLQANSRVCLDSEQWIDLIHIICISDKWEESNDSFRGQLFIYSLTLFLENSKCILYGILHYCPSIYVTLKVSKTSHFMKEKLPYNA